MRRPLFSTQIEPLESRIAPSVIILGGAPFTSSNPLHYTDTSAVNPKTGQPYLQFFATDPSSDFYTNNPSHQTLSGANLAIAETIGENPDTYFIKVSAGEIVEIPTLAGYQQLVNVSKGTVIAVFSNTSNTPEGTDGVVHADNLTGLALGTKTSVSIGDGISEYNGFGGFIVANYNDLTGTLGGATEPAGHATQLLSNTVLSLNVAGPVQGGFIAGGAVSKFTATGSVNEILTGNAANGITFSFEGVSNPTGNTTLNVPIPATGVVGPSISNVTVGSMTSPSGTPGLIQLGGGGPGAAGGSIHGLTVLDQFSGMTVLGGLGGAGGGVRTSGGAGGSITNVVLMPPPAGSSIVNDRISLIGGAGGAASAHGGAGGGVSSVYFDYDSAASSAAGAPNIINNVTVQGGAGGAAGTAGAGGSLNNINILTSTLHDTTSSNPEIQVLGGAGGISATGGKGGAGGSVTNSQVIDDALPVPPNSSSLPDDTVPNSPTDLLVVVMGGAGGTAAVKGAGGVGGAINTLTLKGFNFQISAGAGGNGISAGGTGGSVANVDVLGSSGSLPGDAYHAQSVVVTTGVGGNGAAGKGGASGSINFLTVQNADFGLVNATQATDFGAIAGFQVSTGAGGIGGKGAGGASGSITNMKVTDSDFLTVLHPLGNFGTVSVTTGDGGASPGANGKGGAAGSMSNMTLVGTRLRMSGAPFGVSTGNGGAGGTGAIAGKGGAGGSMSSVAIRSAEGFNPSTITDSGGLLLDTTANFITDGVQVGDTVKNGLTFATTTVTAVTATELGLTDDIFAAGDPYEVIIPGAAAQVFSGIALDSQDTIIDANANFGSSGTNPENVQVGDVVEDVTDTNFNNGVPVTAIVTQVFSSTELIVTSDISHVGDQYEIASLAGITATAGHGGAGVLNGAGGAGGSINNLSAVGPGSISLIGGAGGAGGGTAAAGAGGSLNSDGAFSSFGLGLMQAGSAGTTGAKPGAGGSIIGANIQALTDVTLIAGNGFAGGAGGNINSSGFSGVLQNGGGFNPPSGNVTVEAGAGGTSATGNGGAGGSISTLTGFISTGDGGVNSYLTQFDGGAGGNGVAQAGAGGSVNNIRFFGGGGQGVTFFINAGDAGNATTGKTGATGGSVNNVGGGTFVTGSPDPNFSVSAATDFHHISAGNGGNATKQGGTGGSVHDVFVNAAIGQRTGLVFGFDIAGVNGAGATGAGGISAGMGGTGVTAGHAGSVTNISADAIASIVAGHLHNGDPLLKTNLANKVDEIILNGTTEAAPTLVQQFTITFNGQTTGPLPTNASTIEVAAALNGLSSMPPGGVTVQINPGGGYIVKFVANGAQAPITGNESSVVIDGVTTEVVQGVVQVTNGSGQITTPGVDEVQNVQVDINPFYLTFTSGGVTDQTTLLPPNATPAQVQAALNALANIQALGDVVVTPGTGNGHPGYNVTFESFGPQAPITAVYAPYTAELVPGNVQTSTDEVQQVQVLAPDPFSLSFQGQTTATLAASDTAADVQTALDSLTSIQNAGGVNVTSVNVAQANGSFNPGYNIAFQSPGPEQLITVNFALGVTQTVVGGAGTPSQQTLTLPTRGDFNPVSFDSANMVGSVASLLQVNASHFNYTPLIAPASTFQFGDVPIDGLIAAVNLTANKNFVPEAYVTADAGGNAVLIDNTNT